MITIDKLKALGFKDVSYDQNGMGFRKQLPGGILEICYYVGDRHLKLQTVGSGFTHSLIGVDNEAELIFLWQLLTGKPLKLE